jgi:hypothetical protein
MAFKNCRFFGASYFNIGSGLLPFSITPTYGTYQQDRAMLSTDRVRAGAFDLDADPESGTISPGDVAWLRNLTGYITQSLMEARSQLHSMRGLTGALLGVSHPALVSYGRFLCQCDGMLIRLERELDQGHGR